MITKKANKYDQSYTLRKYHNGKRVGKYKTKRLPKKEFKEFSFFGTDTLNKYIINNNLKNLEK
tara:strand:+ start:230 stop:418 length:189 start_codon:yes stop_codon:yes gene_type:complete